MAAAERQRGREREGEGERGRAHSLFCQASDLPSVGGGEGLRAGL